MIFVYFVFALQHSGLASVSIHAALCSIRSTVPALSARMLGTSLSENQLSLTTVRCGADRAKISAGSTPSESRPTLFILDEPAVVFGSSQGFQSPRTMAGFWLIFPRSVIGQPEPYIGLFSLEGTPYRELHQRTPSECLYQSASSRSFPNMPCAFHLHPGTCCSGSIPLPSPNNAISSANFVDIHASFAYC